MSFRDPSSTNTSETSSNHVSFKIKLTVITVILFVVVIIMVSLHLYSRWYLHRYNGSRHTSAAIRFFGDPFSSTTAVTTRGLDPSVINSLPVVTFSAASTGQNTTECSVCLSRFDENESGRVLPNCKHAFHVDCIDMWFRSHSSCPLCRSLVEPIVAISNSNPVSGNDDQGSMSELCETDNLEETRTSDNSAHEDSRRKPTAIEVPNEGISKNQRTI